jgi:Mrp family chromosome partitioning ATPase
VADLQAEQSDPMWSAWHLTTHPAFFSQLRNVRRELDKILVSRQIRQRAAVIAVTSALPGEGKSFMSLGLARALAAAKDRQVVLVDGDLPKRHLTKLLGTCTQPGLIEGLALGTDIASVLCRTNDSAMTFLPAGLWRTDAPDLLCSSRMERIIESFRECDGRHVFVFDTAPVLAFGETAYLAERVDLVMLVVRADQTPRSAAEDAMQRLKAERPLALVLNGQRGSILDAYYGYGENYGDYSPAGPK